jgi:hypothetical protein
MPEAPNVEGLPLWLQIGITLVFGVATLMAGLRSYRNDGEPKASVVHNPTTIAHLTDMAPIRHLTETLHTATAEIVSLERALRDHEHHMRQQTDLERELCQRLRELRERLDSPTRS